MQKPIRVLCLLALFTAIPVMAATTISDVVVNQRWPWSEKVDVDFILSGDAADVDVTATWDGRSEPYSLGTLFSCTNGNNRLTWDPTESEFAGQTLTGFNVTLTSATTNDHKYLLVDLENGGYSFLSDVPSGGWTGDHKSSIMVFRRIPAGTYTLGEPQASFEHLKHYNPASIAAYCNRRAVTFTSDFYIGIFKYTEAQHACLDTGSPGSSYIPQSLSYDALRGAKDADAIDWPATGYKVASNSVVAKLRAKAGSGMMVDLCEEEQWEAAARAGTTTFWPNGGTVSESLQTISNYVNAITAWYGNTGSTAQKNVGTKSDNGWGLFDVVGLAGEWTLDKARNNGTVPYYGLPETSSNPIGADGSAYSYRILRSANGNGAKTAIYDIITCRRQMSLPSSSSYSTRFCIHLKPLGDLSFP